MPVKPVPGPLNCVVAVTVVPVTAAAVVPPIVVPLIVPPVIATLLAFCNAIVPIPLICAEVKAIACELAAVI